ncbi:4-coumarate--CoA ligase-like 7 [Miscanthus floridulus]|uniref:4-coumarate--CoA ligase-like 7 n=1 Tax=Miscanthus floridulus TaxID=154761 RepID=UPI003459CA5D
MRGQAAAANLVKAAADDGTPPPILRTPELPLPSPDLPLSFPSYALSFLPSLLSMPTPVAPSRPTLVDIGTGDSVPFRTFLSRVCALAAMLRSHVGLAPGDVTFVLVPAGVHVLKLYYAFMSAGSVVSLANPSLTVVEVACLLAPSNPSVVFAVVGTRGKLPPGLRTALAAPRHEPTSAPHVPASLHQ